MRTKLEGLGWKCDSLYNPNCIQLKDALKLFLLNPIPGPILVYFSGNIYMYVCVYYRVHIFQI